MLMSLKEMYSFSEVAERWKVPVKTIEDYLLTGRLIASFFLTGRNLGKYTLVLSEELAYSLDPYIYDIDIDDPDCFLKKSGIFDLCYRDITWDEQGQFTLDSGYDLGLTLPDGEEGFYGLVAPLILKRDDVFIVLSEINRFENEHGITPPVQSGQDNAPDKIATASPGPVPKLHTKEKESLLKMIIVLAVEAYRYNPDDKRSTVPSEIAESAHSLGIPIDVDTVRKWLKEAAGMLSRKKPSD